MKNVLILPCYRPNFRIIELVSYFENYNNLQVILVNNGNNYEYQNIFDELVKINNLILIKVDENQGKGFGIKYALNYISKFKSLNSVIFADSDGQHTNEDIRKFVEYCTNNKLDNTFLIGSRNHNRHTPKKNLIGNILYNFALRIFKKIYLKDSLCGLRAISFTNINELIQIKYNDFKFEIETIFLLKRKNFFFKEIEISSTYFNNAKSNFSSFKDTFQLIYMLFI